MFDYRLIQRPKNVCYVDDPWLAPLIGGALGGLAGLFGGGGDQTSTTTMIPQMTGQQQIMANQLANWLYQAMPQYQGYIQDTLNAIYGGAANAPTIGGAGTMNIPGQLTGEMGERTSENISKEAEYQRKLEDYNKAMGVINSFKQRDQLQNDIQTIKNKLNNPLLSKTAKEALSIQYTQAVNAYNQSEQTIKDFGLDPITAAEYYKEYQADPESFTINFAGEKPQPVAGKPSRTDYLQMAQDAKNAGDYKQMQNYLELSVGNEPPYPELLGITEPAETKGYSPFEEFMSWSPEKIESYFGSEREKTAKEIGDWQSQAMREMEQRGIGQRGGFLGSGTEKDLSRILGEAGQMSTGMNWTINQAEQAMKMDQPLKQLEMAFGALQQMQGMQAPWMNLGAGLINPYGATQVTTQPGASTGANMLGGGLAGLGITGMGSGLGWWGSGQPATNYGYGLTGQSANPYNFQLQGTQNLWNQNPWSLG